MDESFSQAIDRAGLKALSQRSDLKGGVPLLGHLIALSTTGLLVATSLGSTWVVPAMIGHGILLSFLFAPLHETIHRTAFKTRWLNDAVARLCGAVLLLPPTYFRAFHFAHHRYTQDPARDPELSPPKPRDLPAYLLHISGLPYWRAQITGLFRHAMGRVEEPFIPASQRQAVTREARAYIAFYGALLAISVTLQSAAAVWFWAIPVALGQPFLRLYLLTEHTGCPLVPDMFENTRTTRTAWPLRALAWNMPFHVEHHAYPGIPFHALPQAHERLKPRIAVLADGYVSVQREILGDVLRPKRDRAPSD